MVQETGQRLPNAHECDIESFQGSLSGDVSGEQLAIDYYDCFFGCLRNLWYCSVPRVHNDDRASEPAFTTGWAD